MSFSNSRARTACEISYPDAPFQTSFLRLRTCFLPHPTASFLGSSSGSTRLRSIDSYRRSANVVRPVRSNTFIVRCAQADEATNSLELEGKIREMYERSLKETPIENRDLQESDRRVMDGITKSGAAQMKDIVNNMKDDLKGIQQEAAQRATEIIQEETDLLLEKYEKKRLDILDQVKSDRQIIQEELTKLEGMAGDMKKEQNRSDRHLKEKVLLASSMAFIVASLFYAWNGFVNSDTSALTNAAVDAAVAAAAGYFASRRRA